MHRAVLAGLALLAALLTLLVFTGSSEARCDSICLNRQIKGLRYQRLPARMRRIESRLDTQDQYIVWLEERAEQQEARTAELVSRLSNFQACFGEIPLSRYGEELGPSGYLFRLQGEGEAQTLATTALDVTYPKDPVGVWSFVNLCNKDRLEPTPIPSMVRLPRAPSTPVDGLKRADLGLR